MPRRGDIGDDGRRCPQVEPSRASGERSVAGPTSTWRCRRQSGIDLSRYRSPRGRDRIFGSHGCRGERTGLAAFLSSTLHRSPRLPCRVVAGNPGSCDPLRHRERDRDAHRAPRGGSPRLADGCLDPMGSTGSRCRPVRRATDVESWRIAKRHWRGFAGTDRRPPRPPMALTVRRSHGRGRRRLRLRGLLMRSPPAGTVDRTSLAASVHVRPVSMRRTVCMREEFDDGEPGTVYGVTTRDAGRCRRALQPGILSTRMPVRRCVLRRITRSATSRSRCK